MSQATIKDWRAYPAGKEKYQLYLASREWAVLKEAVRARSKGRCERCSDASAASVHHQTYERIYREPLTDLVHVCEPCHSFLSGKRPRDPMLDKPVVLCGRTIKSVYLAGKITGTTWRDEIAPGWSTEMGLDLNEWGVRESVVPIGDGRSIGLSGPFWVDLSLVHGECGSTDNPGLHACGTEEGGEHGSRGDSVETNRYRVRTLLLDSIRRSDLVFAWIDSADCYGTIAEIGYAVGIGKIVLAVFAPGFDSRELWLSGCMATNQIVNASTGLTVSRAWEAVWTSHHAKM